MCVRRTFQKCPPSQWFNVAASIFAICNTHLSRWGFQNKCRIHANPSFLAKCKVSWCNGYDYMPCIILNIIRIHLHIWSWHNRHLNANHFVTFMTKFPAYTNDWKGQNVKRDILIPALEYRPCTAHVLLISRFAIEKASNMKPQTAGP